MDFTEIFKATRTKTQKPVDNKPVENVTVDVRESASTEEVQEKKHNEENCEHVQWETGFWKRFPWIGALAILTMLISIAMDGVILGTSHDKYREEWPAHQGWSWVGAKWKRKSQIAPHVLLAIVNTVTNVALAIAIAHGVAIAWWRRVLKGSTIEDLHKSWGFSSSVLELLTAGKSFNYIALAALMAKVALVDNVLLQQAVSTTNGLYELPDAELRLPITRILPANYAGISSDNEFSRTIAVPDAFSWDLWFLFREGNKIDPYYIYNWMISDVFDTGCTGVCHGVFQGAGFEWQCGDDHVSDQYDVTSDLAYMNTPAGLNAAFAAYDTALASNISATHPADATLSKNPILGIEARYIAPGDYPENPNGNASFVYKVDAPFKNDTLPVGSIGLSILFSKYKSRNESEFTAPNCIGQTTARYCRLRPAVVDYTLQINNVTEEEPLKRKNPDFAATETSPTGAAANGIYLTTNSTLAVPGFSDYWRTSSNGGPFRGQFFGFAADPAAYRPTDSGDHEANLIQITSWLQSSFGSGVLMEHWNSTQFRGYTPNLLSWSSYGSSPVFATSWLNFDPGESCVLAASDPIDIIAGRLNNLMVRSSMRAATQWRTTAENHTEVIETAVQKQRRPQEIPSVYYSTDWPWGIAAMCIIGFCVLCVLPSYWGFWELGRKVTLGPIEVAGAFQAPIMEHPTVATHGEVDEFVKEIGQRKVRYGQVVGQQRLAVANPTELTKPGKVTPPLSPPPAA